MRHTKTLIGAAIAAAFTVGAQAQPTPAAEATQQRAGQQPAGQAQQGQQPQQQAQQQRGQQQQGQQQLTATDLQGQRVHSQQGEPIGQIERVVQGGGGQQMALIRIQEGNRHVMAPLQQLTPHGDGFIVAGGVQQLQEVNAQQQTQLQDVDPQQTLAVGGQMQPGQQQGQAGQPG
jgi:predicted transglutaminase-like cysteine proteinase